MQNKLTARQVKNAAPGKYFDGAGLTFVRTNTGAHWVFRYSFHGKRKEMGLGSWPEVSLAEAREMRAAHRATLATDRDPIATRDQQRAAQRNRMDADNPTLADAVQIVFDARRATLRGDGQRGRWLSPLQIHVIPKIGQIRINDIHQRDIHDTIAPIWKTKHPTAQKCIDRTKIVLEDMEAMGYDCDPRAAIRAKKMLGAHDHKETPIAATPWQQIPDLYARLDSGSAVDDCLRLIILTATRAHAARGAAIDEIDGDVWTVPADRVKATKSQAREFRVALSTEAQRIIKKVTYRDEKLLFAGYTGRPITDAALEKRLTTLGEPGRPHGFRTSFRTWAQDTDGAPWDVAETVLGHSIGNKVERTYARSDLLEKRKVAMEAWARFVTGQHAAKVIPIR